MKKIALTLATIIGAIYLTGCQGTSNSSTPASPAASCVSSAYGAPCYGTSATTCNGQAVTYNPTTGSYMNSYGQPVYGCTGSSISTYGAGLGYGLRRLLLLVDSIYPGTQYVPMIDPTSGQLECINVSSYGISVPSTYNYSQPVYQVSCPYTPYNDPTYYYDCQGYLGGYGGSYGGYNYGGGSEFASARCGDDDGGGYFGICF